jgi:two-component system, sensor histidine kinase YesM
VQQVLLFFKRLNLRTKLVIAFVFLITIPIFILSIKFYGISKENMSDMVKKNAYEIILNDNENADTKLSRIKDNMVSFITDKDLYNAFSEIKPTGNEEIWKLDEKVTEIMNKYFSNLQDVYSVQLSTSYFTFGTNRASKYAHEISKSFIPKGKIINTNLYKEANEAEGKIIWIPTFRFKEMFNLPEFDDTNLDYSYLFCAVNKLKQTYYDGNNYLTFKDGVERPLLIVNYQEDFFQKIFKKNLLVDGSYFFIITKEGQIVSHQDKSKLGKTVKYDWLPKAFENESGTDFLEIDGKKMLVCYDKLKTNDWMSVMVIPYDKMLNKILTSIRAYTLYLAALLIVIAILISYFISSMITKPINKITTAIKKTGEGNFDLALQEEEGEFNELIKRYNRMNEKIQKLIKENYEIKIKENEAEINALNLQLDPHFMYNTLNIVNLMAIANDQEPISEIVTSLSSMLEYSTKNKKDLVSFREDMQYLRGYVYIMTKRFGEKVSVEYDIEEVLYNYKVPKFLMQPFVENSLLHGFNSLQAAGKIKIACWIEGETRYYLVEDNGCGMSEECLKRIISSTESSIGINNIDRRIKIRYGEGYGVKIESAPDKGTRIIINLPLNR